MRVGDPTTFERSTERQRADVLAWLRRGQTEEAQGTPAALTEAVRCYDTAITLATDCHLLDDNRAEGPRLLGVVWMNRGNAWQWQASPDALAEAVRSYDEAIACFTRAHAGSDLDTRISLGAAWMNRGRALQQLRHPDRLAAAIESHERALAVMRELPIGGASAVRRNLAGTWLNLADALLDAASVSDHSARALAAAREALELTAPFEHDQSDFADIGLKARRALCMAIGQMLISPAPVPSVHPSAETTALIGEAGDAVEDGLALICRWEDAGATEFRPLATRLLYFGAELYRRHQPHFLSEFLLEHLDATLTTSALRLDRVLLEVAETVLAAALDDLRRRPSLLVAGDTQLAQLLALREDLSAASSRLAMLRNNLP